MTADGATGARNAELWYKPWGESRGATDEATPTKRRFTGQVLDEVAGGLYFYNARYYDPALPTATRPVRRGRAR
ncbi:MAG: RHS repeat-associated core domain-containing protein [Anaerolineae bacterium]